MLRFENSSSYYASRGSCGDVRKAYLAKNELPALRASGMLVAVKMLRVADNINLEDVKRVSRRTPLLCS